MKVKALLSFRRFITVKQSRQRITSKKTGIVSTTVVKTSSVAARTDSNDLVFSGDAQHCVLL